VPVGRDDDAVPSSPHPTNYVSAWERRCGSFLTASYQLRISVGCTYQRRMPVNEVNRIV